MKIKRFFAKDMKTALSQVKDELGSDAVIMSNKKVAGGVEIVAAVDGDGSKPLHSSSTSRYQAPSDADSKYSGYRSLADDKVSLNQRTPTNEGRFSSVLKQYSAQTSDEDSTYQTSNADSLAALLRRQAESRQNADLTVAQQEIRSLASLFQKETPEEPSRPKLDPTRFEPTRHNEQAQLSADEMASMREEMSSIRRLLEHQVSGLMWQEVERKEPLRAMLIKRLERMGLSLDLADQLACYIPEDTEPSKAWKALLGLVSDQIPTAKQDILKRGGVVALLGPTGVGKTTTIAKLAARAAMEYGPDNVALVTTDTYRIGAHEQLSIYGRIMGCPVRVAKDSKELASVIYQLRNRRLILVDTAGMGQRDVRLSEQLDTLMQESGEVIYSYLVLPATAQRKVLQETIDHFRRIPLSGCIMTKLDESLSLGEFVSVVVQNALPVAYIANGQRVPEDIVAAQPKYMVAKASELLEKSADDEPHYWNSDSEKF